MNANKIWTTKMLNLFGLWLIEQGEIGYGLLSIHGSTLGIKIGDMIDLMWGDFIEEEGNCTDLLMFENKKVNKHSMGSRHLSQYVREITEKVYYSLPQKDTPYDYVYTKRKTEQPLTTSTLNRELLVFQKKFEAELSTLANQKIELRPLKSNAFEIAWARDLVSYYNLSKKAFIEVSKFMGHRSVKETINQLEIEPNDEIFFFFDFYNPEENYNKSLINLFNNPLMMKNFLYNENLLQI